MKATAIALLVALSPIMAQADTETNLARTKQLEKAIRLQTLATQAVRKGDYDLACKAQNVATLATKQAGINDVSSASEMEFAEICNRSTKPWLSVKHTNTGFEPAGVFFVEKH